MSSAKSRKKTAMTVSFSGHVQGVGFREFVQEAAWELGVAGSVKFTIAGVSAFLQGDPDKVEALLQKMEGLPLARLRLRVRHAMPKPRLRGFRVIPSGFARELQEGFGRVSCAMRGTDLRGLG
ncbi:MAG: acylphosphatase [Nitrososphaerota archaeon]|nr:acylphosphatase [Nitrososphaerota archaeon]